LTERPFLSIVVPAYNEEVVMPLHRERRWRRK
jgi:hypothetical protein